MPENKEWPAIFYSPHEDDEAIGMAGAICEHKEAGRPVYMVLLTNGIYPDMLKLLNGESYCSWHQTYHDFNMTMEQMIWARKIEFISSANKLGADKIFIVDNGQGLNDGDVYDNYELFVNRIADIIRYFEAIYPGASHKLVSGVIDAVPDGSTNPTHNACRDAAIMLRNEISDFTFYRIYTYLTNKDDRNSDERLDLKPEWTEAKQSALDQYKLFMPEAGRYAVGYHSAPSLIDAAYDDGQEYVDYLPQI